MTHSPPTTSEERSSDDHAKTDPGAMTSRRRRAALPLALLAAASPEVAAWAGAGRPPGPRGGPATTARRYRTSAEILADDDGAAAMAPPPAPGAGPRAPSATSSLTRLPWLDEDDAADCAFREHWEWQLGFFAGRLANARPREPERDDVADLHYAVREDATGRGRPSARVYTVSLESDEYRDVRMTYMHCPAMEALRCVAYPRDGDLPCLGMGVMKMAGTRHLSIMDYQPLPPTNAAGEAINDRYRRELTAIRRAIPSMSQPMSRRTFDSDEDRKYFTAEPLLGRCDEASATPAAAAAYRRDLRRAQEAFVARHVALTRACAAEGRGEARGGDSARARARHAAFDAHLAAHEPAAPFLKGVFGEEVGRRLVRDVIFPLADAGDGEGR